MKDKNMIVEIKEENIDVFKYETLQAKGSLWIRVTDSLKMSQEAYQEGYQTILDLELMKDEGDYSSDMTVRFLNQDQLARNQFRKELRKSIAEKRGKV